MAGSLRKKIICLTIPCSHAKRFYDHCLPGYEQFRVQIEVVFQYCR